MTMLETSPAMNLMNLCPVWSLQSPQCCFPEVSVTSLGGSGGERQLSDLSALILSLEPRSASAKPSVAALSIGVCPGTSQGVKEGTRGGAMSSEAGNVPGKASEALGPPSVYSKGVTPSTCRDSSTDTCLCVDTHRCTQTGRGTPMCRCICVRTHTQRCPQVQINPDMCKEMHSEKCRHKNQQTYLKMHIYV